MTLVAAKKFGERILVMSDTMISDCDGTRDNIIPGRLKTIVLNTTLTISYAGLSIQAIDCIRHIKKNLESFSMSEIVDLLSDCSAAYENKIDFILCSHVDGNRLLKISGKNVYEGAEIYWIGNQQAAQELSQIKKSEAIVKNHPDYVTPDELAFSSTFVDFLRETRCKGVGGAVINCLCSPYGHCYQSHAGAFSWDVITLGQDDWEERKILNKTGTYHYEYEVYASPERGQALVGLFLPQCSVGFYYDPLHYDEAIKAVDLTQQEFSFTINHASKLFQKMT